MNQVSRRSLTPDQQALWLDAIRIADMPDLGTFTDTSSIVGENAGSGRFTAASLKGYFLPLTGGTVTGPVQFTGEPILFGTGTLATGPNSFQVAFDYDPSTGPSYTRQSVFNTTLTYAAATTQYLGELQLAGVSERPRRGDGRGQRHARISPGQRGRACVLL